MRTANAPTDFAAWLATKISIVGTCWVWNGELDKAGYGKAYLYGRRSLAHRLAYERLVGPIPPGLELDHVRERCSSRACVKAVADEVGPAHLEPVTHRENTLRGDTIPAANLAKTHCSEGHPFDAANTYREPSGARDCRTCRRLRAAKYNARKRAERVGHCGEGDY